MTRSAPVSGGRRTVSAGLRLLATSDLHVNLQSWDYFADEPSPAVGLARTATLIRAARAEQPNVLLMDNGDFLDGSPLGDLVAAQHRIGRNQPHPIIAAMNLLDYDAATIGNHEFAQGIDYLTARLKEAAFPLVSTNLLSVLGENPSADRPLFAADLLLTRDILDADGVRQPIRIGVLGFAPARTVAWLDHILQGRLEVRDIVEAAAARVPLLKAAGADIIIALAHSGIGAAEATPMMENAATALAGLAGIDVVVAGHTHQQFPDPGFPAGPGIDPAQGTLCGKPAVMPGFFGSHLGVIDLDLMRDDQGWKITGHRSHLRPIARRAASGVVEALTDSDPAVEAITKDDHAATRRWSAQRIGQTESDLHTYFAMVSACPAVRLVAQAQRDYVVAALRGTARDGVPVLSAAAPFRAGGRGGPENYTFVPRGPITIRNLADLYYHPNTISALALSGAGVLGWLERAASQFRQILPGAADADLLDTTFPSFTFDSIEGLTWQVDLSRPARFDSHGTLCDPKAHRIVDLQHQGQPVLASDRFIVATNSYRSSGSPHGSIGAARIVLARPVQNRDILSYHIASHDPLPPPEAPNWGFVPMPGSCVTFDSSPRAAGHLADVPQLQVQPLALGPQGFMRFRLTL